MKSKIFFLATFALNAWVTPAANATEGQLWFGAATVEITPEGPVALAGQRRLRIGKKIESPITATALVLETRGADKEEILDQAVFISCDLVAIRKGVPEMLRAELKGKLPGLDPQKIVLNATHTHTGQSIQQRSATRDARAAGHPDRLSGQCTSPRHVWCRSQTQNW